MHDVADMMHGLADTMCDAANMMVEWGVMGRPGSVLEVCLTCSIAIFPQLDVIQEAYGIIKINHPVSLKMGA